MPLFRDVTSLLSSRQLVSLGRNDKYFTTLQTLYFQHLALNFILLSMRVNFRKLKGFIYKHRISAIIVLVAVLAAMGVSYYLLSQNSSFVIPSITLTDNTESETANLVEAPLSGELVAPEVAAKRVIAVIIENHPDARPQSGYNEADVVYETLAEGGITRTLALFQSKDSTEIGPVRSARDYFIKWLSEYDALFAHVGGSATALDMIRTYDIADLNQFYNGSYFWRSSDRYAPHNVYTTTTKLYSAAESNGYATTATTTPFNFKDDVAAESRPVSQVVTVNFSSSLFRVTWTYQPTTNTYNRAVSGVAMKDKNTGVQISPNNVLVLYADISSYVNYAGEQAVSIDTGNGDGVLFQDGVATEITWSKASLTARTIYKDAEGNEVKLNRGQTWIEVVPDTMAATY